MSVYAAWGTQKHHRQSELSERTLECCSERNKKLAMKFCLSSLKRSPNIANFHKLHLWFPLNNFLLEWTYLKKLLNLKHIMEDIYPWNSNRYSALLFEHKNWKCTMFLVLKNQLLQFLWWCSVSSSDSQKILKAAITKKIKITWHKFSLDNFSFFWKCWCP